MISICYEVIESAFLRDLKVMKDILTTYYSYCLQANLRGGVRAIRQTKSSEKQNAKILRRKVIRRFIEKNEINRIHCDDSFIKHIVRTYREYYREVLLTPAKLSSLNEQLDSFLREIAKSEDIKISSNISRKSLEKILSNEIKLRGYYSLFGTVSPFRSLLIWKKQTAKRYSVVLPEGKQRVNVVFMEDFLELSWLHYATFGKYYVGGWAKKDALYCVKQAYKINSPKFLVHYLAHEAQHFSDYKSFPKLQQMDLEYRSKLAELSLTQSPNKFMKKLRLEARNDKHAPHSFAAYKILQNIGDSSSAKIIQLSARALLKEHSEKLKSRGAKTVTTCLVNI